ncbi:AHH domain-containing protein [Chromobacterium piscinae]|uniref:AHH domain-containing protein n=1 Tax=Chromobacterium piscinae TaxID=686831 RepID=UPI001E2ABA85|nr:AHH domain-containing protein [Chromobacterium piscinae]MCD4504668.1 AHH domain-containing protein [Chromobacterium piscinae]
MLGNIKKGTQYREMMAKRTEKDKMPHHPRHFGIKMQAHHIVSAEGINRSKIGDLLVKFGYDINSPSNLVYIPSTLQGACHLSVQPHRGDHKAPLGVLNPLDDDDDDAHPVTYHDAISLRLLELKKFMHENCPGKNPAAREIIKKDIEAISKNVLFLIQNVPAKARLTYVADFFQPNGLGCKGTDNIPKFKDAKGCAVHRNHQQTQGPSQNKENITLVKPTPRFNLQAGM